MDIDKLRSVLLLEKAGKMDSDFTDLVQLQRNYDAYLSDQAFATLLSKVGPGLARELWKFLDRLPDKVGASGHFHFATGLTEPSMAPPGSTASDAALKWSETLSEAVDLASFDFPLQPIAEAKATLDRMERLLSEADPLIAPRLHFFQVGKD